MGRSLKKGPYIDETLYERIEELNRTRQKKVLKTWSRRSTIPPEFVGHTVAVHNGKKFIPVYVTENMVGHVHGDELLAVVDGDRVADELGRDRRAPGPGLQHLLLPGAVQPPDPFVQHPVGVRALRHRASHPFL